MLPILLQQTAAASPTANALAQASVPEREPALMSLVFLSLAGFIGLLLLFALVRFIFNRQRRRTLAQQGGVAGDLPLELRKRLSTTPTNRGLKVLRWVFVAMALFVFSSHVYWARYAEERNERFQQLNYKDLRNRRLSESTLRGWILDRSGDLNKAFASYTRDAQGRITRSYSMPEAMAHILGSERGDAGLERALFGIQSGAAPEALDVLLNRNLKQQANLDVRLTISRELQLAAVEQLKGRHGAVVALNPQTGEILAMYSNPSYNLERVQDEATWIKLDADERDRPLVNRALSSYYIPGSTFKTVTMLASYLAGMQNEKLLCSGNGYYAQPGARPIFDDQGPSEVHGLIDNNIAYQVSCNQFYAQMAVKLGAARMKQAAQLLGIGAYDTPEEALQGKRLPNLWNTGEPAVARALAPREATMVTAPKMRPYDLALEGFGQGYAGQMTPLQMALAASAIANTEGKLMKLKIEYDRPPEVFNQVVTPEAAADMRRVMGLVTAGPRGTARGVFAPVNAAGITTGGKTGTAQKDVPEYNPKTGEAIKIKKQERDNKGNVIREYYVTKIANEQRIDGWFLCIAPLERPTLAMAVIVEGGGYGSRSAAPIAAALVMRAKELGLLGQSGNNPTNNGRDNGKTPAKQSGNQARTPASAPAGGAPNGNVNRSSAARATQNPVRNVDLDPPN